MKINYKEVETVNLGDLSPGETFLSHQALFIVTDVRTESCVGVTGLEDGYHDKWDRTFEVEKVEVEVNIL